LFVEGRLIVEIKACKTCADEHVAQILGYLKSSRIETGLLINFGAPKLQIKKYLMTPPPAAEWSDMKDIRHKKHEEPQKLELSPKAVIITRTQS
jgi:hypothetical protein